MSSILKLMDGFTVGADPELFVFDADGNPTSAYAAGIPGSKFDPFPVDKGAVQRDGLAAEFNINPAKTFEEFEDNITSVMSDLRKMLPKGWKAKTVPSVTFSEDVFITLPESDKVLGCTSDFNAWTGEMNDVPDVSDTPFLRCAGGHLHFGWTDNVDLSDVQHIANCNDLVKQLDWYLGAWSVTKDSDANRRKLYGKAGACRYKPYGVEYRVLSNFWVDDSSLRLEVWNRSVKAIEDMATKFMPERVYPEWQEALIRSINMSEINPSLGGKYPYPVLSVDSRKYY